MGESRPRLPARLCGKEARPSPLGVAPPRPQDRFRANGDSRPEPAAPRGEDEPDNCIPTANAAFWRAFNVLAADESLYPAPSGEGEESLSIDIGLVARPGWGNAGDRFRGEWGREVGRPCIVRPIKLGVPVVYPPPRALSPSYSLPGDAESIRSTGDNGGKLR